MKLCLYQGTFNPIHNAHIHVAEYAIKNLDIDKILFIPAFFPPHKDYDSNISIDRLKMVKSAIENYNNFELSDIEYQLKGKSYTYRTICELYKTYNNIEGKFKFLIGTDAFEKIESWYETQKLKKIIDFIVFIRENENVNFDYLKKEGYNFKFAQLPFTDISSTDIRKRIVQGKKITGLVTKEVEDYIYRNGLYQNT